MNFLKMYCETSQIYRTASIKETFFLLVVLEEKSYYNNFQEYDFLRDLKIQLFSSLQRSSGEKGGNFKSRKESCFTLIKGTHYIYKVQ